MVDTQTSQELLQHADLCVKCGLCLPVCPTYNHYRSESDSPRGRIALIQALASHTLDENDEPTRLHLDRCVGCSACTSACPSGVNFLELLDQTKAAYSLTRFPRWKIRLLSSARAAKALLKLSGIFRPFLPAAYQLAVPDVALPAQATKTYYTKGKVALFSGCVGSTLDRPAIASFSRFLNSFGYEVTEPEQQVCCGAMFAHEGYAEDAASLLHKNIAAFKQAKADAIIYFASGCGAHLLQSQDQFDVPFIEATTFVANLLEHVELPNLPRPTQKIALHSPCSLRNQTDSWPTMLNLLKQLAGEQLVELPGNAICCGSGGLHSLKHLKASKAILQPKLDVLADLIPDVLLTANTGCALHFRTGLEQAGLDIPVMHPVQWIVEHVHYMNNESQQPIDLSNG